MAPRAPVLDFTPQPEVVATMRAHAEASAPNECVGALFGRGNEITKALPLINAAENPTREFELSAAEYLRAEAEAARAGLELLGFFHSHVDAPASPSAKDLEHASAFRCGYIVPVRNGVAGPPVAF